MHWFFRRDSKKIPIEIYKNMFPLIAPPHPPPPGAMILTNLILHYVRYLSCKSDFLVVQNSPVGNSKLLYFYNF
jgi:hypothetical protein